MVEAISIETYVLVLVLMEGVTWLSLTKKN